MKKIMAIHRIDTWFFQMFQTYALHVCSRYVMVVSVLEESLYV